MAEGFVFCKIITYDIILYDDTLHVRMTKVIERKKALELRAQGYSYAYISRKIKVSKGTLNAWLSKTSYTPNNFTLNVIKNASNKAVMAKKKMKRDSEELAYKEAKDEIKHFTKRDLFMLGIGLYIGEGSKTEVVRIVNSDPRVLRIAISWFHNIYNLRNSNFKIRIHLYPDCVEGEAVRYWAKQTRLPVQCFQKTSWDRRTDKKSKNIGKLPFGTAHLSINGNGDKKLGRHFLRKLLSLIELVAQKADVV